jgi:hypothetical protein
MATLEDVRRIALALPDTAEDRGHGGTATWKVRGRLFLWERPLGKADLAAHGEVEQSGPVLGVRVVDEGAKHALVADEPEVFFTTPHFDGYPAVLVRLDALCEQVLEELAVEAWLDRAPKRLAKQWLAGRDAAG